MHMANELLSVPVAAGTLVLAGSGLSLVCRKARQVITTDKLALMGILGAFVFAGQMVNFQLPAMPGTSGHMVGAVLLAIILGPHAAVIVMASVVIIQCLIFQDGGLLALGCNIINMAIVPTYLGYFLYKTAAGGQTSRSRIYIGAVLACVIAVEAGAILVPVQTLLSAVLAVPFSTFLVTMIGVHFLVGIIEGLITIAVLAYLQKVRPDLIINSSVSKAKPSTKSVLIIMFALTIITAGGLSLLASELPDGLEWSYAERPDQPDFEPIVSNKDSTVVAVDDFQSRYSLLPEYSIRTSGLGNTPQQQEDVSFGWTSFAGVIGSGLTMFSIWLIAWILRKKRRPAI